MMVSKAVLNEFEKKISAQYWQRGKDYYHEGLVRDVVITDNVVNATCEGNSVYRLSIDLSKKEMDCSCPCGFPCKHLAALIMWLKSNFPLESKGIESELSLLSKEKLVSILSRIFKQNPDLVSFIKPANEEEVSKLIKKLWLSEDDKRGFIHKSQYIRDILSKTKDMRSKKLFLKRLIDLYDHFHESNEVDTEICLFLEELRKQKISKKEREEIKIIVADYPFDDFIY